MNTSSFVMPINSCSLSIAALLLPFILLLFFQWISWKYTNKHNKRKLKIRFIVISSLGFALLVFCVALLGVNESESRFTTEKWLNDDKGRVYLVDDLTYKIDVRNKNIIDQSIQKHV